MDLLASVIGILLAFMISSARADEAVNIYAWRQDTADDIPGAVAFVWARVFESQRDGASGRTVNVTREPAEVAKEVVALMRARGQISAPVFLWNAGVFGSRNGELPLFPPGDLNIDAYARGGFTKFTAQWMNQFWRELAASGRRPKFIILDYEGAAGFWGLKRDFPRTSEVPSSVPDWAVGTVVAMTMLQRKLAAPPAGFQPLDYVMENGRWAWNRDAVSSFNRKYMKARYTAIVEAVFDPAWNVFGADTPACNYGDQLRAWPGMDQNGWMLPSVSYVISWSCPVTYLSISGNLYRLRLSETSRSRKSALQWIRRRNDVRSALALNSQVAPWYSNPDFGLESGESVEEHRLRWAAGIILDHDEGVSNFLIWSDSRWSADELALANTVFSHLRHSTPVPLARSESISENDPEKTMKSWVARAKSIIRDVHLDPPKGMRVDGNR